MKRWLVLFAALLLACRTAQARDGFEAVRCGADVRGALIGRRMSDEPVARIEARHAGMGLKNLGGGEISDRLNSTSWLICRSEFVVTTGKDDIVRDALAFPPHSRISPEFAIGACRANGKDVPSTIIAVLDNRHRGSGPAHYSADDGTLLPAMAAWAIDGRTGGFSAVSTKGLSCPRSGIVTADGGP